MKGARYFSFPLSRFVPALSLASRNAQDGVNGASTQQTRQQRHNADQFDIVPSARALVVKKPNQQCHADSDSQDAVNGTSVIYEQLSPPFQPAFWRDRGIVSKYLNVKLMQINENARTVRCGR